MHYSDYAARMKDFIQDVIGYHSLVDCHPNGDIIFSRQMAALVLPDLSHEELNMVLRQLETNGVISITSEDPLSFAPKGFTRVKAILRDAACQDNGIEVG